MKKKIKKRKMNITGQEHSVYSSQELADGEQNYSNLFSQEPSYTNFEVFGVDFLQALIDTDLAKGVKATNITDDTGQTCLSLVPVDSNGNELGFTFTASRGGDGKGTPPPVRCPTVCGA